MALRSSCCFETRGGGGISLSGSFATGKPPSFTSIVFIASSWLAIAAGASLFGTRFKRRSHGRRAQEDGGCL